MPTVTIHLREVDNDAKLGGDLSVSGATNLEGNSIVDGTLSVGGNASFAGEIQTSNLDVGGKLSVQGNSKFVGDTVIDKSLSLGGNIFATETQTSNLNVNGNTFIEGLVGIGVTDPTDALDVSGNINFSGTLKQGGNPFVSTPWTIQSNPAALSYTAGNIGINTTSPGRLLEVFTGNGNIPGLRLRRYATGSTYTDFQHADNTSPANSKEGLAIITSDGNATTQEVMRICVGGVGIGTTSPAYKLHIHQNDLSVYQRFTTTASGQTDIFDIAQWNSTRNNGDTGVMFINRANSDMRFLNNDIEVMRLKANGNVGIGTDAPESRLHVNGNAIIGDIGVTTGLGHTDAQLILAGTHNTNYNNSDKIKLLISGGNNDGNSPYDIMCEDENGHDNFWLKGPVNEGGTDGVMYMKGKIGIRTSSPARALDVHAAARPSDYPFSIGGTWSNRSKYLAVEVNPGNNKTSLYRDFLMGGHSRPIWVRVHYAGSASGSGQLQQTGYAEFTVSLYGTNTYATRRAGDAHISIARNGVHNGFRVTMGSGRNMSYPRAWIEVYSETGVYF